MPTAPSSPGSPQAARKTSQQRRKVLLLLLALLIGSALLSLALGARPLPLTSVSNYLTGQNLNPTDVAVLDHRLARTLWACLVGAALALAGAGLQGITRNPLGDPGILGLNAGASFALVAGISLFSISGQETYALWAFCGASITALAVYFLASLGSGGATPIKLALMGAATTAGLGSLTTALILGHQNSLDNLRRWQVGTVAGAEISDLYPAGLLLGLGALLVLASAQSINNLALGDDMASALGQKVALSRLQLTLGVTLLVGTAVALAGPIGFVGLMAPHAIRSLIGADYRYLLPYSALLGASLLTLADTLGRILLPPQEIPVGVSMVLLGVPVLIYLVRRGKAVNL